MSICPRARKRFGQHFLKDGRAADRIVDIADIGSGDTVLEIGPGKGILTGRLLDRGADIVTAVEVDRKLVELLKNRFSGRSNLRLVEADILSVDLKNLFRDITGRIKVVSNIPYNISTPIIELLIQNRKLVSDAVLMMQKEVAVRLTASSGSKDYGLTTLNLALCARSRKIMDIKPGAFEPPPEVMSSVIAIRFDEHYLYPLSNEQTFREITGAAFRKRRKMIRNTMIPYMVSRGITEPEANTILADAGVEPVSRPETLDVSAFVAVSNGLDALLGSGSFGERI